MFSVFSCAAAEPDEVRVGIFGWNFRTRDVRKFPVTFVIILSIAPTVVFRTRIAREKARRGLE